MNQEQWWTAKGKILENNAMVLPFVKKKKARRRIMAMRKERIKVA
jgi:hypothetical protein